MKATRYGCFFKRIATISEDLAFFMEYHRPFRPFASARQAPCWIPGWSRIHKSISGRPCLQISWNSVRESSIKASSKRQMPRLSAMNSQVLMEQAEEKGEIGWRSMHHSQKQQREVTRVAVRLRQMHWKFSEGGRGLLDEGFKLEEAVHE